ncbi:fibronectin type III domain-containing protein [Nocardioides sp. WS12]|uniref:fibronectin type III domain-containing protein n=1 Tax=Nocardioides sp. WS12 TaxID=2486272 RepID=UPI0015F86065|nr:fibronectin type III domain-containing protein [Nocardioides sp. WS12]
MMRFLARLVAAILFLTLAVDATAAEAATRPSAPRAVKATPGNQAVKVSWVVPASNGGAAIDRYAVQRRASTTASWVTVKFTTGSARSWTNTGLTNGKKYYFRVLAHNRRGYGTASTTVAATPRTVPLSPRNPAATTRLLSFSTGWDAPTSNGGAPIDFYLVEISTDGAVWTTPKKWRPGIDTAAPLFTGLIGGDQYYFRIRAHNAAGYSVGTGAGPYRAHTTPNAVTGLNAVAGNGQVTLTWTAPGSDLANTGVPAASTYKVEKSTDGGTNWTSAGPNTSSTSYTATSLTNGTAYKFRVTAGTNITNLPFGPATETTATTPIGAPTPPLNLTLNWRLDEGNVLAWDAPESDGGIDLTRYVVEYWTDPEDRDTFTTGDGSTLETTVDAAALDHNFRVKACNGPDEIDCSPYSATIGPIPGGVQSLDAVDTSDDTAASVTLGWDTPAGATPDDYTVSRTTDVAATPEDTTWTVFAPTADTTYVDETADYGTTYKYRVVANGANGSGTWVFDEVTTRPQYVLSTSHSAIQVTEGGAGGSFQVTLDPVVQNDTVIQVSTSDSDVAVPTTSTVTIQAGQSSASVTINGVADANLTNEPAIITLTYGTQTKQVTVTVNDDDTQALVLTDDTVTMTESGSQIVDVSLAFQPTSNVTVNVGSSDTDTATVGPSTLTFTPGNWNVPQSVTINGVAAGLATVSLSSASAPTATVDVTVEAP